MLFFQSKDITIKTTVKPNTVYRNKINGEAVIICGVSRPVTKSALNIDDILGTYSMKVMDAGYNEYTFETHQCGDITKGQYVHNKKDFSTTIVMFKGTELEHPNEPQIFDATPLSDFLDNYELVIGYTTDGDMITQSMLDNRCDGRCLCNHE